MIIWSSQRFGNRYFENLNAEEEVPGKPSEPSYYLVGAENVQVVTAGSTTLRSALLPNRTQ